MSRHWAVILAGGDGVRLRSMTRSIAGDDRPDAFAVLPVRGVHWYDLGDPERVMATCRRTQAISMMESIPA